MQDEQSQHVAEVHSASPAPQLQVRVPVSARPQARGAQVPSVVQGSPLPIPWHCSSVSVAAPPVVAEVVAAVDPPAPLAAEVAGEVVDVTRVAPAPAPPEPLVTLAVPEVGVPEEGVPAAVAVTPLLELADPVAVGVPTALAVGAVVLPAPAEVWLALPSGGEAGSSEEHPLAMPKPAALSQMMVARAFAALTFMVPPGPAALGRQLEIIGRGGAG